MSKVPLTARGAELLRDELQRLKRVERPAVVEAIAEARAHGDLKENAEYHAAKDQQGLLEARVRDIESKLSHAQVIEVMKLPRDGRVVFGVTVVLVDEDDEEENEVVYQIVGEDEADIREGRISFTSPIARALIGRAEGDSAVVAAPGGERVYEILKVRYE
jgi:transcription elongation factor GreA